MERRRKSKKTGGSRRKEISDKDSKQQSLLGFQEKDIDRFLPLLCVVLTLLLFRKFVFSDEMLFGTDTIAAGVFFRSFYAHVVRTFHTFPLWDPYILGGLPFVDAMHGDTFYPTASLKFFISIYRALGYKLIIHICLAGLTSYHCAKSFGLSKYSSLFVGLAYMFSANLVSLVYGGHGGKIYVITIFPLSLYLLNRGLESRKMFHFLLLGAATGLMILTAHIQMAYFALWGIGLYFLYRLYCMRREGKKIIFGLVSKFAFAMVIGVAASAVQLIPPYIYLNKYSPRAEGGRGYEFATSWSLHAEEVVSLVFPDFSGLDTGSQGRYWGRNFFKINSEYSGIVPFLFAILAVCLRRKENRFWLVILVLSIIYALGADTPVFKLFYYLIPGVRVFRAPSLITFLFTFSVLLLSGRGLDYMRKEEGEEGRNKILKILTISTAGLFGFVILITASPGFFFSMWTRVFYSGITQEKMSILQQTQGTIVRGLWLSSLVVAISLAAVYATKSSWNRNFPILILVLSAVAIADLWRVDSKFIQVVSPESYFGRDRAVDFVKQDKDKFRVFPLPGTYPQNHLAFHRIEEVTGHHGNELRRYREFVADENVAKMRFINLLNVKYIMTRSSIEHPLFKKVFSGDGVIVYENLDMLPRSFIVHRYEVIEDADRVLKRLLEESFDYRNCIILEEDPGVTLEPAGTDTTTDSGEWTRIKDETVNSFFLECELVKPGFVFLSENYYPSWKAFEGDTEIPVYRSDYTFRAVYLEEGRHRIHFRFESFPMKLGSWITLLAVAGILGVVMYELTLKRNK